MTPRLIFTGGPFYRVDGSHEALVPEGISADPISLAALELAERPLEGVLHW
jgi:hypothetical protein